VNAFLEELRCRKVYRVAAGYAVVAWLIIQVDVHWKGDFARFNALLAEIPDGAGTDKEIECVARRARLRLYQRRYDQLLTEGQKLSDAEVNRFPEAAAGRYLAEGVARLRLGNEVAGRAALLKAKENAERFVREAPNDPVRHSTLAEVLAFLGEKEPAIAEARRAMELRPESLDAFDGPKHTAMLAQVYAILGEQEAAIDLLDGLLSRPSSITVALLKAAPVWDNLRENPRFQALLTKYGASS
jgi:tetratricopeptide (TPR) repeat protein